MINHLNYCAQIIYSMGLHSHPKSSQNK